MKTLAERDHAAIWHPLTQHQMVNLPMPIVKGEGAYLYDEHGKRYIDFTSSWWVNIHGHSHPVIAKAIYDQALTLEHVIFSGFTHEPAIKLAEKLLAILPKGFNKVFFSDNGSTTVEVALKMAFQYWQNLGKHSKKKFAAFEMGYHGETLGAMSVSQSSFYPQQFKPLLFPVHLFPYPSTWMDDKDQKEKEKLSLTKIQTYFEQHAEELAAIIIEPLIQAGSGMHMCSVEFLQQLEKLAKKHDILVIYDEVMTGFGRTGELFAATKSNTSPDIMCLAKGITGGFLPLATTVCKEKIYEAFLSDDYQKMFAHSHSFTANPLGCAAAVASLDLLLSEATQAKIKQIEKIHHEELKNLSTEFTDKIRCMGTVAAFNIKMSDQYGSRLSIDLRERFLKKGVLIRPIGNVVYLMPPYCVDELDLRNTYRIIAEVIQGVSHVTHG